MLKIRFSALLGCVLLASSALASPTVYVTQTSGYYSGTGGEFAVTPDGELAAAIGSSNPFPSFCLELNEYISMGSTYDAVLNTGAVKGGVAGQEPANFDPLDPKTAYLYTRFLDGTLQDLGYDYTDTTPGGGRSQSAGALQNVIWYLENETTTLSATGLENAFYTAAVTAVDVDHSWTGLGNVRVLNLYDVDHAGSLENVRQDVLVSVATVPAPGAMILVGLGTSLVGWLRRRQTL